MMMTEEEPSGLQRVNTTEGLVSRLVGAVTKLSESGPVGVVLGPPVESPEDYNRLQRAIAFVRGTKQEVVVFNHWPYYRRALKLRQEEMITAALPRVGILEAPTGDRGSYRREIMAIHREKVRRDLFLPLIKKGLVSRVYILSNARKDGEGEPWYVLAARAAAIEVEFIDPLESFA